MSVVRPGLVFAIVLTGPPALPAAEPTTAAVDAVMADALKAWGVPGAALVVIHGDRVVVLNGYGRKHADRPELVGPDTLFPIASCTKSFTATLLAMLVDDGQVQWDDPVRNHLPSFKLSDPHADALVTLRDLLSHRTGVTGHDLLWYRSPATIDDILKRVDRLPLTYPFRGGFDYSSIMYMAAGRAAAHRTGQPWEKLVKERIAEPLGMAGLRFTTKDLPADRASGHHKGKDGKVGLMPAYDMPEPNPSGSIHASARDLASWLKFHLAGGVANGKRLVSLKNLQETQLPQNIIRLDGAARAMNPDTVQLSYGMGWVVSDHRGKRVLAHGGMIDGFRVQITLLPDQQLGIAVLNNLHEARMNQAITNTLIDRYCDLPSRDWNAFFLKFVADTVAAKQAAVEARNKARKPNTKPSLAAEGYVGTFADSAYGPVTITAKDGQLQLAWSSFRCPLEHFQDDVFRVTEGYFEDKLVEFAAVPGQGTTALRFIGVVFKKN